MGVASEDMDVAPIFSYTGLAAQALAKLFTGHMQSLRSYLSYRITASKFLYGGVSHRLHFEDAEPLEERSDPSHIVSDIKMAVTSEFLRSRNFAWKAEASGFHQDGFGFMKYLPRLDAFCQNEWS